MPNTQYCMCFVFGTCMTYWVIIPVKIDLFRNCAYFFMEQPEPKHFTQVCEVGCPIKNMQNSETGQF